jgi:hypothetical protein
MKCNVKRANHGSPLKQGTKHKKPAAPVAQTGKNPRDAREDESQLSKNQRELGVEEDHKTDEMEEGDRGTFP